jgi:WD40 repeat protein
MIGVWRTSDWSRLDTPQLGDGVVNQLIWRPDSRSLLVLSNFQLLQEVDVLAKPPAVRRSWTPGLYRIALSPDGKQIIGAVGDGPLGQMDLDSSQSERFGDVRREILALAAQPGGKVIATAGVDAVLRFIDDQGRVVATGTALPRGRQIVQLAWKPDGSLIVGAVSDKSVVVWRADGTLQATYPDRLRLQAQSIAWSADGQQLVVLGANGKQYQSSCRRVCLGGCERSRSGCHGD